MKADGLVVEASIVARLLGIRLLKLDATVVIAPADVSAPRDARRATVARIPPAPRRASGTHGASLAEAVRRIEEAAAVLDEARHIAPSPASTRRRSARSPRDAARVRRRPDGPAPRTR